MIKKFDTYTVICDGCQLDSNEDGEFSGWNSEEDAIDIANDADFREINGGDYCPKCYYHDDEDNLVVKTNQIK